MCCCGSERGCDRCLWLQVTEHVAQVSRWVAADLYAKEIDLLQFELSMSQCNVDLWERVVELRKREEEAGARLAA